MMSCLGAHAWGVQIGARVCFGIVNSRKCELLRVKMVMDNYKTCLVAVWKNVSIDLWLPMYLEFHPIFHMSYFWSYTPALRISYLSGSWN